MKTLKRIWFVAGFMGASLIGQAQTKFSNCSAVFIDNRIVVDDYSPTGKCALTQDAQGTLSVAQATYENNQWHQTAAIDFMVAIRDKNTKTLTMFSKEVYQKVDIKNVLSKCNKGDAIVLLTLKDSYALPHNEIEIH